MHIARVPGNVDFDLSVDVIIIENIYELSVVVDLLSNAYVNILERFHDHFPQCETLLT
jgi:hypothetical protein